MVDESNKKIISSKVFQYLDQEILFKELEELLFGETSFGNLNIDQSKHFFHALQYYNMDKEAITSSEAQVMKEKCIG